MKLKDNKILLFTYIFIAISSIFYPHYISKIGQNNPYITFFPLSFIIFLGTYLIYKRSFELFVPTLFFVIFYLSYPLMKLQIELLKIDFPGIDFLIPVSTYLLIILFTKPFRKEISWLQVGSIDHLSWIIILAMIALSTIALISWTVLIKPDLSQINSFFLDYNPALLFLGGFGFALSNALVEEFIFRGVFWDGLKIVIPKINHVIIVQALLFGLLHINGIPSGILGVSLVFIWGIFLGIIRYRSQGLFGCVLTHLFADLTIFGILFVTMNK